MNKPMRILIVEDAKAAQVVAKLHLTELNCIVDTADNGIAALGKANNTRYDAILMDLGLSNGPNGFETTNLIKTQSLFNKNTPIIALTIHSEVQFNAQASAVGMAGFLYKPFTLSEAKELVDSIKKL
ncbi:response regulator [Legionella sp. CNM-1927-20]|uniref:response regulator n=1 Tax=Legionella sp. CNM-1927-20 TaxID=3422221 RepID=UPI00403ACDAA